MRGRVQTMCELTFRFRAAIGLAVGHHLAAPWQNPRCIRPAMHHLLDGAAPQTPGQR